MKFGDYEIVNVTHIPNSDMQLLELENGDIVIEYPGKDGVTNFYVIQKES